MRYVVTFERIGRRRDLPPITVEGADGDEIAEAVWRFANRHLGSKMFDVYVDLEAMRGTIEQGRFGAFTLELAP